MAPLPSNPVDTHTSPLVNIPTVGNSGDPATHIPTAGVYDSLTVTLQGAVCHIAATFTWCHIILVILGHIGGTVIQCSLSSRTPAARIKTLSERIVEAEKLYDLAHGHVETETSWTQVYTDTSACVCELRGIRDGPWFRKIWSCAPYTGTSARFSETYDRLKRFTAQLSHTEEAESAPSAQGQAQGSPRA